MRHREAETQAEGEAGLYHENSRPSCSRKRHVSLPLYLKMDTNSHKKVYKDMIVPSRPFQNVSAEAK